MSTTPDQINLWRSASSEHQRLEFKEAKTQFDFRRLCQYCVAIANEGGGNLLFGVADKPPRPVVGTAAVNDPVGMAEKLFQMLGFRVDVDEVRHKQPLAFSVAGHRAARATCPFPCESDL